MNHLWQIRKKTKKIEIGSYGGLDVLRIVETDTPQPAPGDVLIKVQAFGVNYSDIVLL